MTSMQYESGRRARAASHGSTLEALYAQEIRLAVSDIVIFMGQCGR